VSAADPLEITLDGRCLVEASAGTGKTFTIALLYVRLVMESGLDADQILVVTYTRAAAAELRERIRARLQETVHALEVMLETGQHIDRGPHSKVQSMVDASLARGRAGEELEQLRRALRGFDEAEISTIHGFCQRMLDENAFESGVALGTDLVPNQRSLVDDVVADFWTRTLYDAEPEFAAWLRRASRAGERRGPRLLSALADTVASHPRIAVRPEQAPDASAGLAARQQALERLQRIWREQGPDGLDVLVRAVEQKALHGSAFRKQNIPTVWRSEIEAALEDPFVGFAASKPGQSPSGLARITRSRVEGKANKGKQAPTHPLFDAAEELVAADTACVAAFEARWLGLELELISYTRAELARRRRASRTRSYDELLTVLADALDGEGGEALASSIRERFPAALIDEFQDTDPVQYSIFRSVWGDGKGAFFLIGDPKQAIYGFRGADVFAYMQAKVDAAQSTVHLDRNWRSDPAVIGGVNALFSGVAMPFLFGAIGFHEAVPAPDAENRLVASGRDAGLRLLYMSQAEGGRPSKGLAKQQACAGVADDIAELLTSSATLDGAPVRASDVAVLCRTNLQARAVQEQLRRRGVPSVMQTQQSVFETDEAAALERVVAAAAEPGNPAAVRAAITTAWVGVDAAELAAIDEDPALLDPWLARAEDWGGRLRGQGALSLVEHVLHAHGARERLLGEVGGERRLTNLLHLAELLQANARSGAGNPRAQLRWLVRMRRDAAARSEQAGDDAIIRLESDARAVQLVTIHRSKGLQYGIVYCPFLWDGQLLSKRDETWARFHDDGEGGRLTLDLGSDRHEASVARSRYEGLAESLRLLYVALTRAKHQLVVVWGAVKQGEYAALGYLLHPPDGADRLAAGQDPALVEACKARFRSLDDAAMHADLDALLARAGDVVSVEPLAGTGAPRMAAPPEPRRLAPAREMGRRITQRRHVSSFSRLVATDAATPASSAADLAVPDEHPAAAGHDYDATAPGAETAARVSASDEQPVTLHAFPAGAGPGTLIHEVLEHHDFASAVPGALESLCEQGLARAGMPRRLAPELAAGLGEALATPLGGPLEDFALRDLARDARLDEMEFALPVAPGRGGPLTPARLGEAFAAHAVSPDVRAYAGRAASLGFAALSGHLRGFVDLIFRRAGRYYVVDYKSNRLGSHASDYLPERLAAEMRRHDYTLQYHLYVVALHRLLSLRLPDYSPERHLGGVYYLFVRGMSPATGAEAGVHYDHPPSSLVEALSALLDGAPEAARGEGGR